MKKLIFLLILAVAFAGFMPAWETVGPPGALALEAALYGDCVAIHAVSPYTVLEAALPVTAELASFQAVMALYNDGIAMRPQMSGTIPVINTGQFEAVSAADADYHMRL